MSARAVTTRIATTSPVSPPGNIPVPLLSILGRDADIQTIVDRLDELETRVLTLVGPGGVGKTRLAQEVARRTSDRFAHGVWFVPLAAVLAAEQIPAEIAHALQIEISTGANALHQVIRFLERRHLLLVLDNLEHLARGAAEPLSALVRGCPRIKVLVTSRVALHVPGEAVHNVPPLPVPSSASGLAGDAGPAVALFIRQAQALRPAFTPNSTTVNTIAHICQAVDGLPLAIELAASRIAVLAPGEILHRLENPLDLLARSSRDAGDRHNSLRNSIAWSHDLLPAPAQALFRQLSVYVGGFDLAAVDTICALPHSAWSPGEFLAALDILVEHHLVKVAEVGGSRRIMMPETIREFGLDMLAAGDDEADARDAHAGYARAVALRQGPLTRSTETLEAMSVLRLEWANIQVAATWLASRGRVDDAVTMYSALHSFLKRENLIEHGKRAYDSWLRDPGIGQEARSLALLRSGEFGAYLGERAQAADRTGEAIRSFRANGDLEHLAIALIRGFPQPDNADEERESIARWEEGLDLATRLDSPVVASYAYGNLCWTRISRGEIDEAIAIATRWAAGARSAGLELPEANANLALGYCFQHRRHFDEAISLFLSSAAIFAKHQLWSTEVSALQHLGTLYLEMREWDEARETLEQALDLACVQGLHAAAGTTSLLLAELSLHEYRLEPALRHARSALSPSRSHPHEAVLAACCAVFAGVASRSGDSGAAAVFLGASEFHWQGFPDEELDIERQSRQQVTVSVEQDLGPEAFATAFAEGAALSVPDIVERAMTWQIPGGVAWSRTPGAAAQAHLTARELHVLQLMCDGMGNTQIARKLDISSHTATAHVSHILVRLNVTSRTAAVAWAIRNGVA